MIFFNICQLKNYVLYKNIKKIFVTLADLFRVIFLLPGNAGFPKLIG